MSGPAQGTNPQALSLVTLCLLLGVLLGAFIPWAQFRELMPYVGSRFGHWPATQPGARTGQAQARPPMSGADSLDNLHYNIKSVLCPQLSHGGFPSSRQVPDRLMHEAALHVPYTRQAQFGGEYGLEAVHALSFISRASYTQAVLQAAGANIGNPESQQQQLFSPSAPSLECPVLAPWTLYGAESHPVYACRLPDLATLTVPVRLPAAAASAPACIVYAVDSTSGHAFEESVLSGTPCEVHSFQCQGAGTMNDALPGAGTVGRSAGRYHHHRWCSRSAPGAGAMAEEAAAVHQLPPHGQPQGHVARSSGALLHADAHAGGSGMHRRRRSRVLLRADTSSSSSRPGRLGQDEMAAAHPASAGQQAGSPGGADGGRAGGRADGPSMDFAEVSA